MNFLEKDLENIIWESDNIKLQQKNLPIEGKKFRQLRIGNYGVLDLLTVEKKYYPDWGNCKNVPYLNLTVYELKKENVSVSTFLQALRYCKGIKSYIELKNIDVPFKLNIVLCAKKIDTHSSFMYLVDLINKEIEVPDGLLNSIEVYSFEYLLDGINFIKHEDYDLQHKGF